MDIPRQTAHPLSFPVFTSPFSHFTTVSPYMTAIMKFPESFLLVLVFLVQLITAQVFQNARYAVNYPSISEACARALNTTVSKCPSFLGDVSGDNSRLTSEQLVELCTSDCHASLTSVQKTITTGCNKTDSISLNGIDQPATVIIDRFLYTYGLSCRKDSSSGQFCDEIFVSWLNQSQLTAAQNCSDCMLGMMQAQLNSPFGYDDEFAKDFNSTTKSCTASEYAFTSPLPYALNSTSTAPSIPTNSPICSDPYEVQANDTCDSISLAHNVSTHAIISAGGLSPSCSNLQAVGSICLPASCDLYRVDFDDTCKDIIKKHPWLDAIQLLNWNPNMNMVCGNIDGLLGTFICVGPPGGHAPQPTVTTTTTTTSSSSSETPPAKTTGVPKPTNAPPESNPRCKKWYVIQEGDFCDKISVTQGIVLQDFYFLNPGINSTCGNLMLGLAYCVQPVGDISTYKGYPTTSQFYTLPPISYSTTTSSLPSAPPPVITPIKHLPMAPGTLEGCEFYVEHYPVPSLQEQAASNKVLGISNSINSCDHVLATYEVTMEQFLSWNPSLHSIQPCMLQPDYSYCASNGTSSEQRETTHPNNKKPAELNRFEPAEPPSICLPVKKKEIPPGSLSNCSCFTTIEGGEKDVRPCEAIAGDSLITVEQLINGTHGLDLIATKVSMQILMMGRTVRFVLVSSRTARRPTESSS